ncbi:Uncharacterised protein [Mycobacterium tuberculosis]|nr:Uncharacterised protein [Mycobacterium tuberculosis]CNZ88558.1 Uncharacterised protein [Mycobacterium tuberculosis]CRD66153.1 Uncharacterised protein [Mycobacterium tuberculosis]
MHGRADLDNLADPDRPRRWVGAEQPADQKVALTRHRQVLVDDDSDLQAAADQFLLVGRHPQDDLPQAVQRRSAAQLGDHGTVRAGDNVRFPDRPAALRHHGNAVRAGQAHADQPGGEHVAVTKQPGVAPPTPTAHHPADDGRSRQVGVEVLDEQIRRERVRVRQQQVQVVRGPVEAVTGDQSARAGANEVQVECLRGWAGRQPHRHRGLVLQLVATGDDALGHATDQRGRLDRRLHRSQQVHGLVGV